MKYAEIPYDVVYDEEILSDKLKDYDWLHLHHEDFTGQYGRFYASFHQTAWYQTEVKNNEETAKTIVNDIINNYYQLFIDFEINMDKIQNDNKKDIFSAE